MGGFDGAGGTGCGFLSELSAGRGGDGVVQGGGGVGLFAWTAGGEEGTGQG